MSEHVSTTPKWGDPIESIPLKRREELMRLEDQQQEWAKQPGSERGESHFEDQDLNGAEAFFLSAYTLINDSRKLDDAVRELQAGVVRVNFGLHLECANLNGAVLSGAILAGAHLEGANLSSTILDHSNLTATDLKGADLNHADLTGVNLESADLSGANLGEVNLSGAFLAIAKLHEANLRGSDLTGARLFRADLSGADLRVTSMDKATRLNDCTLSGALLEQATLQDVNLTVVDWSEVNILGDEVAARMPRNAARGDKRQLIRIYEFRAAIRAYRALAVALQAQGLTRPADRFVYRAQLCQRDLYWLQGVSQWPALFVSMFLWGLAGYGYRLRRIVLAYVAVLLMFTAMYVAAGVHSHIGEPGIQAWWDSFLVSLTAIHGRTTFEQLGAWSVAAWVAGLESVVGIVIEGLFVAMLIQRFFAR